MSFKGVTVFLYDLTTGVFIGEFPSYPAVERKYSFYPGAVYDAIRKTNGIMQTKNLIVSKEKFDVYPLDTLPEFKKIKVKEKTEIVSGLPVTILTEEQLRQKHDMFFKVMTYVNKIPIGSFVDEGQMLRELGLYGKPRYRDAITRPELKDFKGKVDGTVYYGHQESIRKLKNEGVLQ